MHSSQDSAGVFFVTDRAPKGIENRENECKARFET